MSDSFNLRRVIRVVPGVDVDEAPPAALEAKPEAEDWGQVTAHVVLNDTRQGLRLPDFRPYVPHHHLFVRMPSRDVAALKLTDGLFLATSSLLQLPELIARGTIGLDSLGDVFCTTDAERDALKQRIELMKGEANAEQYDVNSVESMNVDLRAVIAQINTLAEARVRSYSDPHDIFEWLDHSLFV